MTKREVLLNFPLSFGTKFSVSLMLAIGNMLLDPRSLAKSAFVIKRGKKVDTRGMTHTQAHTRTHALNQ